MGLLKKETDEEERKQLIKEIGELDQEIFDLLKERDKISKEYNEAVKKLEKEDNQIRSLTKLIVKESVRLENSPLDTVSKSELTNRIEDLEKATKFSRDKKLRRMGINPVHVTKKVNIIEKELDKKDKKRRHKAVKLRKLSS